MPNVRRSLEHVRRKMGKARPLIEQDFLTDGVSLFVTRFSHLINVTAEGQVALRAVLEASLRRIDRDPKGLALRLYPWLKDPSEPRHIVIDPLRSFGRPLLVAGGVPTGILAERFRAGDTMQALSLDYGLEHELVESAIAYQAEATGGASTDRGWCCGLHPDGG